MTPAWMFWIADPAMAFLGLILMIWCEERDRWGNACFSLRNFGFGAFLLGLSIYGALEQFGVIKG